MWGEEIVSALKPSRDGLASIGFGHISVVGSVPMLVLYVSGTDLYPQSDEINHMLGLSLHNLSLMGVTELRHLKTTPNVISFSIIMDWRVKSMYLLVPINTTRGYIRWLRKNIELVGIEKLHRMIRAGIKHTEISQYLQEEPVYE